METKTKNRASTKQNSAGSKNEIRIERALNLPANNVWQALTDPELVKKWWGPKDFTCPTSSIDLRIGGKYLNCMVSPKGEEYWSVGVYKEIRPQEELVYTDSFSDENGNVVSASSHNMPGNWPMELLITITLEENGENTILNLRHEGIPPEMHKECTQGWNESFDKLEKSI